ncbi:MAG TPA: alpha/beta hydrolase [Kofleriaceae bacterium]|nr:alpha/beta hydrolase [Kofleriaceae bacterium]
MSWFDGFHAHTVTVNGVELFLRTGGRVNGPPLLLLHGYPQTHAIWHRVAPVLADEFALVIPDLRGYGRSAKPDGGPDHVAYSKRVMAADQVALMAALGHPRFFVAGHDRGGRVAHRLALDHSDRVARLCVLDISPTLTMYEGTTMALARAYYHWFHLIQPAPIPERHIMADPIAELHEKLGGWGTTDRGFFDPRAMAEYEAAFADPKTVHATCEDYRAAAGIDLDHDRTSRATGQKLTMPLHVLWGARGVVHRLFKPIDDWRAVSDAEVTGRLLPGGHYLPEEHPDDVARELRAFFTADYV